MKKSKRHKHLPLNARRFRSYFVDTLVVAPLVSCPVILLSLFAYDAVGKVTGVLIWIAVFYTFFRDSIGGASIGKRYYSLQVVRKKTKKPAGFFAALLRNAILYIPLLGLIDLIVLLVDPEAQRISDRMIGYEVVIVD